MMPKSFKSSFANFTYGMYSVKKFMNVSSGTEIWTYNTTRPTNFNCFLDEVYNITETEVLFSRSYKINGKWSMANKIGTFRFKNPGLMIVGEE
ncbi:hypothetical protein MTO96_033110, partial [Rhipicephalus appendiculatus]